MAKEDNKKRDLRELRLDRMFETRSHEWEAAGLAVEVSEKKVRRARIEAIILLPALIALLVAWHNHLSWFGKHTGTTGRIIAVPLFTILGWAFARAMGRLAGPTFMRRMDPGTAGTVGFLVRLVTIAIVVLEALHLSGLQGASRTLALAGHVGGGDRRLPASQQTLGNVIAGTVLLSARPFRVGDRIRFQAGAIGGQIEGVVSSLGLLYTSGGTRR